MVRGVQGAALGRPANAALGRPASAALKPLQILVYSPSVRWEAIPLTLGNLPNVDLPWL